MVIKQRFKGLSKNVYRMGLMKLTGFVFSPVLLSGFQISGFEVEEQSFVLCSATGS